MVEGASARAALMVMPLAALALVLALTLAVGSADAATPRCTIEGTGHADHLVGTPHRDVICGKGGNDWINGRGGNDVLLGGPGNDRLIGGPGKDDLQGGPGNDFLTGGPGYDTCKDAPGSAGTSCERWVGKQRAVPHHGLPVGPPCCKLVPAPDTLPPAEAWFGFSKRYIDTSTGDGTIAVHVEAFDDSGLAPATIQIDGPAGPWRTVTLPPVSAIRDEATLAIPASTAAGDYRITAVTIADTKGNSRSLKTGQFEAGPWTEFEVFHGPDTEGPQLTGFTLSDTQIDTSSAPGTITATIEAEDGLSGVQSAYAAIQLPGWEQGPLILIGSCSDEERPNSGTRHAGTWFEEYPLIRHAIPGTYLVSGVYLCDLAGNTTHWNKEELEGLGYPTEFVETGAGDSTAPEILGFWLEPATLHAAAGAASVNFYMHVRDDDTGVGSLSVNFDHPGPSGEFGYTGHAAELVSGTDQDGVWREVATLYVDAPIGTYHVTQLSASDRAGNTGYVKAPELAMSGWPSTFENLP